MKAAVALSFSIHIGCAASIQFSGTAAGSTNGVFAENVTVNITSTFANRSIFFSLDGTPPFLGGPNTYAGPFQLTNSTTVRALAVNLDDFSDTQADEARVTIVPLYSVRLTNPGGSAIVIPIAESYLENSVVTLRSDPNDGWQFSHWEADGSVLGTNAVMELTVDRNFSVRAVFLTPVSAVVTGNGRISVEPSEELYRYGSTVRLVPEPDPGSYFSIWGGRRVVRRLPWTSKSILGIPRCPHFFFHWEVVRRMFTSVRVAMAW